MDKIRFAIGTTHVFQGYDDGVHGMAGPQVLVSAHTLAEVVDHIQTDINVTPWDREHNPPTGEMDALAFGDSDALAPDGRTPLYRLNTFFATIVQRYDPTIPCHRDGSGLLGRWVNEAAIDAENPWQDMEPGTFEPVCHGFVISRQDVAEDRSDAPLIETMADRVAAEVKANGWDDGDGPDTLPYTDHDGKPTADPRCWLGLCVECIDSFLSIGQVPVIPALSTHDPKYLTDAAYRAEVVEAFGLAGLTLRQG